MRSGLEDEDEEVRPCLLLASPHSSEPALFLKNKNQGLDELRE